MTYECAAHRLPDDELMVTAQLTVVLVDLDERRPVPIPDALRDGDPRLRGRRSRSVSDPLEALERILDRRRRAGRRPPLDGAGAAEEPGISGRASRSSKRASSCSGRARASRTSRDATRVPIAFQGAPVGELWVDGEADPAFLERVAALMSAHVLIGWDTRGEGPGSLAARD